MWALPAARTAEGATIETGGRPQELGEAGDGSPRSPQEADPATP